MLKKNYLLDTLFWLCIIFYLDPAGWFRLNFSDGRFTQFYFFVAIIFLFVFSLLTANKRYARIFKDIWIRRYTRFVIIFLTYWLLIYCYLNTPLFKGDSAILPIFRTRRVIMEMIIVYPIYYFTIRSAALFVKLFYLSTIIILTLYFYSIIFSLDIVQINYANRGFTDISRNLLYGYGLFQFSVFFGVVAFFMPVKKNKVIKGLIIAGLFAILMWIITIVRRELLGIILTILISLYIFNRLFMKNYYKNIKKSFTYIVVILLLMGVFFPNYFKPVINSFETIYSSVFDKNNSSETDIKRVSLTANTFIINIIKEYSLLGTGYTQKWYVREGDEEGYEGSDYIFLATIAQNGVFGIALMSFFYFIVFRLIKTYHTFFRKNRKLIFEQADVYYIYIIIFLSMSIYYIRHLFEIPNWYYPFGAIADSPKFFIALGLMLGSGKKITILFNQQFKFLKPE